MATRKKPAKKSTKKRAKATPATDEMVMEFPLEEAPITPFLDGRDSNGRFVAGNPGGPGNPHARRVQEFRAVLFDAVTADDLREIATNLKDMAKGGNLDAVKLLLARLLGRPMQHNINENLTQDSELKLLIVEKLIEAPVEQTEGGES